MFGGGGSDYNPAIWKMEYVMENRLKRLIEGSESRTNSVTEKRYRKQRKEAKRSERRIKENVEKHYKTLHEELDRRQKWIDDRIESIRAPATRKRIASLEGLVSQLIRRVDKLEMSSRLGYPRKKIRNTFQRIYEYDEDDEEDDNYGRSVLMEQAEEYRKRDLSMKKKKKKKRRRRRRVVEEEDTEEEEEDETKTQKEEKDKISRIKKIQPKTIRIVESPYINHRHEKNDEDSLIMSSLNRTRQSLEESHGRCTAALRNAGIII